MDIKKRDLLKDEMYQYYIDVVIEYCPPFIQHFTLIRKVWRYQSGNQNPYIEEEQTTQRAKEEEQTT